MTNAPDQAAPNQAPGASAAWLYQMQPSPGVWLEGTRARPVNVILSEVLGMPQARQLFEASRINFVNVIKAYLANLYQANRVHHFVNEPEESRKITHWIDAAMFRLCQ